MRKIHRESMKKPAKTAVIPDGDEKIVRGDLREEMKSPVKQGGSRRFGRWFLGKPGTKKNSAKVSDPMAIE